MMQYKIVNVQLREEVESKKAGFSVGRYRAGNPCVKCQRSMLSSVACPCLTQSLAHALYKVSRLNEFWE